MSVRAHTRVHTHFVYHLNQFGRAVFCIPLAFLTDKIMHKQTQNICYAQMFLQYQSHEIKLVFKTGHVYDNLIIDVKTLRLEIMSEK